MHSTFEEGARDLDGRIILYSSSCKSNLGLAQLLTLVGKPEGILRGFRTDLALEEGCELADCLIRAGLDTDFPSLPDDFDENLYFVSQIPLP